MKKKSRLLAFCLSMVLMLGCMNPIGVFAEGEGVTYETFLIGNLGTGFYPQDGYWELPCTATTVIPGNAWTTGYTVDAAIDYGNGAEPQTLRPTIVKRSEEDGMHFNLFTISLKEEPLEGTKFTIIAGKYTGTSGDITYGIQIPCDYVYLYEGGAWIREYTEIELTGVDRVSYSDSDRWRLNLDTSPVLADGFELFSGLVVERNGNPCGATLYRNDKRLCMWLYDYAEKIPASGTTLTVKSGIGIGETGTNVKVMKDFTLTYDGSGWIYKAEQAKKQGDANGDGSVDVRDVVRVKRYLEQVMSEVFWADMNGDNKIDETDVTLLRQYLISPKWREAATTHGRCVANEDGTVGLFWTNSGMSFRFNGTGVTASLAASTANEAARGYLNVYVDGALEPSKTICLDKTDGTYVLAENLTAGEHTIDICKRNEAWYGDSATITVNDVEVTNGHFLTRGETMQHKIEFIGDSITSGYGNMITDGTGDYTTATSDGTKTYAVLAAKQLGAEVTILSRSGIAFCRGTDAHDSIYDYYTKTASLPGKAYCDEEWNFAEHPSDVIVINLGTNDNGATIKGEKITDDYMTAEAIAFLQLVRKKNPEAVIIWAYGMLEQSRGSAIQKAVEKRNEAGDEKVFYLSLREADKTTEGIGTHLHPTIRTNIDRSMVMAEFIAAKTGWSVNEAVANYYKSLLTK